MTLISTTTFLLKDRKKIIDGSLARYLFRLNPLLQFIFINILQILTFD